jgi:purine-binding chemotaxis protein CheW
VLNLRGRIVTLVDLASRLELKSSANFIPHLAIGIEVGAESFGILVDSVAEVLSLPDGERETLPINLDAGLAKASAGVFRLERDLLVVLDADRIIDIHGRAAAA